MVKPYFAQELETTVKSIKGAAAGADLVFPIVADSHLSDNGDNTRENISAVNAELDFPFMVHLGDLLNGNNPEKISRKNLREEIAAYRACVKSGRMFIAQGNHDGYRDESYVRQLVTDIALDGNWYEDTGYIDALCDVKREGDKPYFYYDIAELSLRMIFLCTNGYEHDPEKKIFNKKYAISDEQVKWFGSAALDTPKGYTVMLFSHIAPFAIDYKAEEPSYFFGHEQENHDKIIELIHAYQRGERVELDGESYDYTDKDATFGVWLFGHDHSDCVVEWHGLMCIGITSQTAYVPQLWKPLGNFPGPRDMGTVREDAWDTLIWHRKKRRITLIRFGCGEDRVIIY